MNEEKNSNSGYIAAAIVAIVLGAFMQNTRAEDFGLMLLGFGVLGLGAMAFARK